MIKNNNNNNEYKKLVWTALIVYVLINSLILFGSANKIKEVPYNNFLAKVSSNEVNTVYINFNNSNFKFKDDEDNLYITANPKYVGFKAFLLDNNIKVEESEGNLISSLFKVVFYGMLFALIVSTLHQSNFANEKFLDEVDNNSNVKFDDVVGCDEVKEDLSLIVDFLKKPEKFTDLGARLPRGLILYGPPGTGKTLLAKAVAGEANVPFFSLSGSDFVEMYVGLGAKRVKKLFKNARKKAPCIIFIDEMDSVGKKRNSNSDSEREQTINALLKELDGFDQRQGIVVIGATNRLEDLDEALIRPGRFDNHIAIPQPELKDRLKLLKMHSKNKKLSEDINLDEWAKMTVGFSGATIETLLNESIIKAIKNNRNTITNNDIEESFYKSIMKGTRKDKHEDEKQRELVAWHESGHAICSKLLTNYSIPKVTITPFSSGAGGVTFRIPKKEGLYSKKELLDNIKVLYGGRVAEELLFNNKDDITIGASQDIKSASEIINEYICTYGFDDEIGLINTNIITGNEEDILELSKKISRECYYSTRSLLKEYKPLLKIIADTLIDKETINEEELDLLINNYKELKAK